MGPEKAFIYNSVISKDIYSIRTDNMDRKAKITRDMTLGDIVVKYPEVAGVMIKHGLHCVGCHVAAYETLEQGASAHGMSEKEMESMIREMNEVVNNLRKKNKKDK